MALADRIPGSRADNRSRAEAVDSQGRAEGADSQGRAEAVDSQGRAAGVGSPTAAGIEGPVAVRARTAANPPAAGRKDISGGFGVDIGFP
jgi:hypothetical protein